MSAHVMQVLLAGKGTVQTQIAQGTGTAIGNMTASGGLAGAFDGVTNQAASASAVINSGDRTIGYVGKDWGAGVTKTLSGVKVWSPNDFGFNQIEAGTVTIETQGSTDNFASSIVTLATGTVSSGETAGSTFTQLSGFDVSTAYRYHRIKITSAAAGTATDNKYCAELQFFDQE